MEIKSIKSQEGYGCKSNWNSYYKHDTRPCTWLHICSNWRLRAIKVDVFEDRQIWFECAHTGEVKVVKEDDVVLRADLRTLPVVVKQVLPADLPTSCHVAVFFCFIKVYLKLYLLIIHRIVYTFDLDSTHSSSPGSTSQYILLSVFQPHLHVAKTPDLLDGQSRSDVHGSYLYVW